MPGSTYVRVGGKVLELSNLEKVLYPAAGFTKREVLRYYSRIAPVLLPHLKGRALTLKRFPEGVEGESFFEKRCPHFRPKWLRTIRVREDLAFCEITDVAGLLWIANLACLELHTSLALAPRVEAPTLLVFDLDPGPGAAMRECCEVALKLRERLADAGLESYAKTSGSKGLQLYCPVAAADFGETKAFSRALAEEFEGRWPELVISRYPKRLRAGKVLIDWAQNDESKTTVCVYPLRAMSVPAVTTPLFWSEVETAARAHREEPLRFEAHEVLRRVERNGDLFAGVLGGGHALPEVRRSGEVRSARKRYFR
ncbi:MAG: non-homologous end-joining DNA ligase [Oligoflexia bacterium]|nr:non-homologous end-joining DNA ligase [Oligoflexia bacterium]